ncbi:MAG: hypothetical protein QM658_02595 [Gordonia sp. (in: high G+C Gram-positive bacteria)]
MSSNPLRSLFGRPQIRRATPAQRAALTDAFFACERAMGDIANALQAARSASAGPVPTGEWDAVRDRYDGVISRYLALSADESPEATPAAVDACLHEFGQVTGALAYFADRHARLLNTGRSAISGAAHAEQQARVAATGALQALDQALPEHSGLSSVRAAADGLAAALSAFEASAGPAERRRTGEAVVAAARRVEQRLADAPGLAADAEKTLRSLATRREALGTRSEALPETMSQLLREFSAACSEDLKTVPADARTELEQADAHLARARELLRSAPDEARDEAELARSRLTDADEDLDRVFDRLRDLREVKRDPTAFGGRVRFRVRDAQHLATTHRLVAEWGSVLDAQSARLDRAGATLTKIHPDYWAYLTELRAVDARITEIIGRMRDEIARR